MSNSSPDSGKNSTKLKGSAQLDTEASPSQHYQWPPARDPNLDYKNKTRNPLHSIIVALPLIMLVTGLYIYYRGESRQTQSVPIQAESIESSAVFTGLSATRGRHYLWLDADGVAKGVRVQEGQVPQLETLVRDAPILVKMAPSVPGSTTYWAWYVEQNGKVFLDSQDSLR